MRFQVCFNEVCHKATTPTGLFHVTSQPSPGCFRAMLRQPHPQNRHGARKPRPDVTRPRPARWTQRRCSRLAEKRGCPFTRRRKKISSNFSAFPFTKKNGPKALNFLRGDRCFLATFGRQHTLLLRGAPWPLPTFGPALRVGPWAPPMASKWLGKRPPGSYSHDRNPLGGRAWVAAFVHHPHPQQRSHIKVVAEQCSGQSQK